MAEETQAPVNQTPDPALNAVEQKIPETEKVNGQLPEDAKERTKSEFEKLQTQLREERQSREQLEAAYKSLLQPKNEIKETPIYDPESGLINPDELTKLQKRAQEAEEKAQKALDEATKIKQEGEFAKAYIKYDWTNPHSDKFDKKRSNLAAAIALASMVNPNEYGGKQLDLEGAAEFVEGLTSKQVEQVKADTAKQVIEQLSPKEQAALEATGSSGRREPDQSTLDFEDVKVATRKGGNDGLVATMARLRELKKNQET